MKIVYAAKHGSGGNDDEGAIAHALRELGHEVICVPESFPMTGVRGDFVLYHHWAHIGSIHSVLPKVFWCFDLIDWPEPAVRHAQRRRWAEESLAGCLLGFFTDGEWARKDRTGKARWLPQGADGRVVRRTKDGEPGSVLYAGGTGYGREGWLDIMRREFAGFRHVKGVYREHLASLIDDNRVVLCPPTPISRYYWSNRVFVLGGFGACAVHSADCELIYPGVSYYGDIDHQIGVVKRLLDDKDLRIHRSDIAYRNTIEANLYVHRCAELVEEVRRCL